MKTYKILIIFNEIMTAAIFFLSWVAGDLGMEIFFGIIFLANHLNMINLMDEVKE